MKKRVMTRPEQQAMFARLNAGRTQGAINRDLSVGATETLPNTPENVKSWKQNPRRIDIEGIDTPVDRRLPEKKDETPSRKSKEELKEARELKVHLGGYWSRPEEIFARLIEQYTAYKNQDLSEAESYYSNRPYDWYARTPAYWSKGEFEKLVPELENEINRKIKLASTEA